MRIRGEVVRGFKFRHPNLLVVGIGGCWGWEGDSEYFLSSEKKSIEQRVFSYAHHLVDESATFFMLVEHVPRNERHFPSVLRRISCEEVVVLELLSIFTRDVDGQ